MTSQDRDGLSRHGFTEAGEAATGVDRDAAAQLGVAVVEQAFRFALLAQADVLVPVEAEGRGEVVHLGQREVVGADAGLFVGGVGDRLLERALVAGSTAVESVAMSGRSMIVLG